MRTELKAGGILSKVRIEKKMTLDDVAKNTFIAKETLQAIENDRLSFFQSRVNAEGIAQKYADYLGLDGRSISALVRRDYMVILPENSSPIFDPYSPKHNIKFDSWWWGSMLVLFLAIAFFIYQIFLYILPPGLTISEPSAKRFKRVEKIQVRGKVSAESEVIVNGRPANVEMDGDFYIDVGVVSGVNNIEITVTGPNGRQTKKTLELVNE